MQYLFVVETSLVHFEEINRCFGDDEDVGGIAEDIVVDGDNIDVYRH